MQYRFDASSSVPSEFDVTMTKFDNWSIYCFVQLRHRDVNTAKISELWVFHKLTIIHFVSLVN